MQRTSGSGSELKVQYGRFAAADCWNGLHSVALSFMDLPFIDLKSVWHLGARAEPPEARMGNKNLNYEFGLLSVSLEPEAWRENWAGSSGEVFKFRAPQRSIRFVETDLSLSVQRSEFTAATMRMNLIDDSLGQFGPSRTLYQCLRPAEPSQLQLENCHFEDQSADKRRVEPRLVS